MAQSNTLDVRLYGESIGSIARLAGDQHIFAFNENYIENENRPTFSLFYKDALGGLITRLDPTRRRLPAFFSNLLPEGALRGYLAARAEVNQAQEFSLLWVLGQDLPGALTVHGPDAEIWPDSGKDEAEVAEARDRRDHALRFSLAGVQLKFSAVNDASGGLTIPASGAGGHWIVKLPSATYAGVPENEFSMMELARMIGLDVPETQLVPVEKIAGIPEGVDRISSNAFAVKRFDRTDDGEAVHIEDFAQVFGVFPEQKYENASYRNIAEVIAAEAGNEGVAEFIRRLAFNALIGNGDMHLKNWSLIYPDRRRAALAPAYDFVATVAYTLDKKMALNLAGSGSKNYVDLDVDAFRRLAAKAALPSNLVTNAVEETRGLFNDVWTIEKNNLPLSNDVVEAIDRQQAKLKF